MNKELDRLNASDYYPFHMPGHKRAVKDTPLSGAYGRDITEIDGFDALDCPRGMIKDLQDRAGRYYGADRAFILVNGSTCGILSAISCAVSHRQKLLMARNSHKSAYDAVYLGELDARYLFPDHIEEYGISGGISLSAIDKALNNEPDIKAVFLTSPTYEGILSDIDGIADLVHSHDLPLIVDAAHGAHLDMPKKADIVLVSLHKTLPAFTSSALCLLNGRRIDPEKLKFYINIFQTSSPSYIIMSGIEDCFDIMEKLGKEGLKNWEERLDLTYRSLEDNDFIKAVGPLVEGKDGVYKKDPSKICVYDKSRHLSGRGIYDILRDKYHIQPEAASGRICLCLSSIMDSDEGFERLIEALRKIDEYLRSR